ncbi:hypothetical protein BRC62_04010 [Halobacteriales archaeon QH_10_67_13]|nr:MAG: hypothetical protein BRC62_04010 [Halobacteriales archaeon QH_10_67_13]
MVEAHDLYNQSVLPDLRELRPGERTTRNEYDCVDTDPGGPRDLVPAMRVSVGHGKDILLQYPRRLEEEYEEIGEDDGLFIGEYVLLSEADISQIYFEEDIDVD